MLYKLYTKICNQFLICLWLLFVLIKDTAQELPAIIIFRYLSIHLQTKMTPAAHTSYKTADESLLNPC